MSEAMNIVSLDQIISETKARKVVPLCLTADIALGGGIPFGCTAIVGAPPKFGKTSSILQAAANAQQLYDTEVYFFNVERRLTNKVLSQIQGIKKDKFFIIQPPYKTNKKGEVIGQEMWSSATWLEYVGDIVSTKRNVFIIVDSLSKLASEKVQSEGLDYQDRGASKKVETAFYQRFGDLVVPNENILAFIAQGYANVTGYGHATMIKVGSSIKYQADLILVGKKVEKWKENPQNQRIEGHDMIYQVDECPLGPPHMEMRIPLRYGKGVDTVKDVINHAINWGLIVRSAAWYKPPYVEDIEGNFHYCPVEEQEEYTKGSDMTPVKLQGEVALYNWMLLHTKECKEIEGKIRHQIFGDDW